MKGGDFYIGNVKKHKKYIAVYAIQDGEYYKIIGAHGSQIEKLKKHQTYNLYIERICPSPGCASFNISKSGNIPLEHKMGIFKLFRLVNIEAEK